MVGLGILHRDLARKYILITIGKYLKFADFGLSQEVKDMYVTQCFINLLFRWMAPEALTQMTYTENSMCVSCGMCTHACTHSHSHTHRHGYGHRHTHTHTDTDTDSCNPLHSVAVSQLLVCCLLIPPHSHS